MIVPRALGANQESKAEEGPSEAAQ
jgi:hypothetical protein